MVKVLKNNVDPVMSTAVYVEDPHVLEGASSSIGGHPAHRQALRLLYR